jgi:ADP-heptose:LPS heptosyltransferase
VKPRLLVLELRMMGDAVMSLPFLRAAAERFEVHIACAPAGREVLEMALPKERVVVWQPPWLAESASSNPGHSQGGGTLDFVKRLRAVRADVAVSVWPDARTHILMGLSGARERIGFPMTAVNYYANHLGWRKRQLLLGPMLGALGGLCLLRPLLTRKLFKHDYLQHHVENWRQLADALSLNWNAITPWLNAPEGKLPEAVEIFLASAQGARRRVWLVHPGARTPNRRWAWAGFERVIRETLLPADAAVVVVKPPELDLPATGDTGWCVAAPKDLAELLRLTSRVDHVLCNDTGMAHIAAALGKRTVGIFTANLPQWFAPYGSADLVVDHNACPHRPCLDRCVMPSFVCREAVTVEMVQARVAQLLGEPVKAVVPVARKDAR